MQKNKLKNIVQSSNIAGLLMKYHVYRIR